MEIRQVQSSEIFDSNSFKQSCIDYAEESGNPCFGKANPQVEAYKMLESIGRWKASAAFEGGVLVGFVAVLRSPHLHYGTDIAIVETLWLDKKHRKGTAGLRLIREAQRLAIEEFEVANLLCSAPAGSRLSQLLAKIARKTDECFHFYLR